MLLFVCNVSIRLEHVPFMLNPTAKIGESAIAEFAGVWLLASVLLSGINRK